MRRYPRIWVNCGRCGTTGIEPEPESAGYIARLWGSIRIAFNCPEQCVKCKGVGLVPIERTNKILSALLNNECGGGPEVEKREYHRNAAFRDAPWKRKRQASR